MMENIKKIEKGTIIRTIVLLLALVNQILVTIGRSPLPIENATVDLLISTSWTTVAALWAWWKNNSFTQNALQAQEILHYLKNGDQEGQEMQDIEEDVL